MARIVYFLREPTTFIENDIALLRRRHEVTVVECRSRRPQPLRVWRLLRDHDLAFAWFASWHALVPALAARLQGRPMVVVVGGYDTARVPGIAYGNQRGGLRRLVTGAVLRLATRLVAVSRTSRAEVEALGVPAGKIVLCFNGVDPARYPDPGLPREDLALTIGGVTRGNLLRKGLEPFVRAAALVPEVRFVLAGPWADGAIERLRALAGPNVTFTGRLSHEEKVRWLWRARVAVQVSQHEAFGLSMVEGMLCGGIPVVTDAAALPEIAGGTGVVVRSQDPAEVAEGIRRALALGSSASARARARALEFTLERRAAALEALVDELLGVPAARGRRGRLAA